MQPAPKQELVRLLEFTEGERRREQAKSNRRLIEPQADRLERGIEQCPLPRRQCRNIRQRKPRAAIVQLASARPAAPLRQTLRKDPSP